MTPQVKPLSYSHRSTFFYLLLAIFIAALPFLFLYATGYRFQFGEQALVSTGGLYVAADRTGAEIYIDDQLVRETRVFRRAFYSQGLEATTHRVHVQKENHHTWVKELPVYPHLVTEALAFNLPLVPDIEIHSPWITASGVDVLLTKPAILMNASSSSQYLLEPRADVDTLEENPDYEELLEYFSTTSVAMQQTTLADNLFNREVATSTATTSKEWQGVKLFENAGEVFAQFVGKQENMPYYYCAEDFPRYIPNASSTPINTASVVLANELDKDDLELETQSVAENTICDPIIKLDDSNESIYYFDFFPNSTDLVVLGQESGVYVVEIDDRGWQNKQPILIGENLDVRIVNGNIYIYDGTYVYRVMVNQTWF